MKLGTLRQLVVQYFSLAELETLCFDLDVKYDNLPGQGLDHKARDLIAYMHRTSRLDDFLQAVKEQRPSVNWDAATQGTDREEIVLTVQQTPTAYWGAAVLLFALSSVLIFTMLNRNNQPTEPAAASLAIADQLTSLPLSEENTSLTESVTPTASATPGVTPSVTPTMMATATPTLEPVTVTSEPEIQLGDDLSFDCISRDFWTPYRGAAIPVESGCWLLAQWGFTAENDGLHIAYGPPRGPLQRGIYTPLSEIEIVELMVRVDDLTSQFDIEPALVIGFVPLNDPRPDNGIFVLFKIERSAQEDAFVKLRQLTGRESYLQGSDGTSLRYPIGVDWHVFFAIHEGSFTLFINGEQIGNAISLPATENALWIGYDLTETASVDGFVSILGVEP